MAIQLSETQTMIEASPDMAEAAGQAEELYPTQQVIDPMVTVTERAQAYALRAVKKKGGRFLRLGVRGGGCSGLSYVMRPDSEFSERDRTWVLPTGLRVVIDQKSMLFLEGTTIDYDLKNLLEGGFTFNNPNSVKSCGCGTSFTPRV